MIHSLLIFIILQSWFNFQYGYDFYNITSSKSIFTVTNNDFIWDTYIHEVYGKNYKIKKNKQDINFIYKNALINVVPLDWPISFDLFLASRGIHTAHIRRSYRTFEIYDNYSWVEVTRETHNEGLLEGNLTYGCWFHKFHGTGIFVNIGRSITFAKDDGEKYWPINNTYFTWHPMIPCRKYHCLCPHALASGYDSVQVEATNEVVICNQGCEKEFVTRTCPPLDFRKGDVNANQTCQCNEKTTLLNCGDENNGNNTANKNEFGVGVMSNNEIMYSDKEYIHGNQIRPVTCVSKNNYIKNISSNITIDFDITLLMNFNSISRSNPTEYHKIKSTIYNDQYPNVIMLGYRQNMYHKSRYSFYCTILKGFTDSFYQMINFHYLNSTDIIFTEEYQPFTTYEDDYSYKLLNHVISMIIKNNIYTIGIVRFNYNYIINELKILISLDYAINNYMNFLKEEILCLLTLGSDIIILIEENVGLNDLSYDMLVYTRNKLSYGLNHYIDILFVMDNYQNLTDNVFNINDNNYYNQPQNTTNYYFTNNISNHHYHSNRSYNKNKAHIEIISLEYSITREINIYRRNNDIHIKSNNF